MDKSRRNVFFKKWKLVLLLIGFVFVLGLFFLWVKFTHLALYPRSVLIGNTRYSLEVADTEEEQTRGLGGRKSFCHRCALLFIFPEERYWAFWMKDVRFPIDIIWLKNDVIVGVEQNLLPLSERVFRSKEESNRVLEVNADDINIFRIGEVVRYEY
ncbi:MAG: DUF192 domain-containing protein [Candidatus Moranbacteria bacterium]|jgi:uncharacterized membrane protein (UPF0127 family)|nr:DUF192 domain-containing protein [Candidatus Moranbacteria bacterium]MBP9801564.1 DUF192 domain-containing protein [Candidatus Moranbacteria bacterium]